MSDEAPNKKLFRLPKELEGGVTFERLEEIEQAEQEGRPIDVTDEERAEIDHAKAAMSEAALHLQQSLTGNFRGMFDRLNTVTGPLTQPAPTVPKRMPPPAPFEAGSFSKDQQEMMDSIAEAKREEREREDQNSQNIQVTVEVMKDMLAAMNAQSEDATERDEQARKAASKNFWIALGSMVFAALAIIAPFVIEAIKGWD